MEPRLTPPANGLDVKDTGVRDTGVNDMDVKETDVQEMDVQETDVEETDVKEMDVRIPSDVQYIEAIVQQVVARCAAQHFSRRHLALNVPVALTEALSNAILRGNGDDRAKSVRVRAAFHADRMVVEVRDEGVGFDLEACTEDPTTAENLMREDGRGLFLMRRLMDEVERFSDGGNVVRLVLRRAAVPQAVAQVAVQAAPQAAAQAAAR